MIKYADGLFDELADIASYLAHYNEATAQRFLDSCEETFDLLERFPDSGSPRRFEDPELTSIRMSLVKGFDDYLVFYIPLGEGVRILHVIHSALDYNRIVDISDLQYAGREGLDVRPGISERVNSEPSGHRAIG